MPVVGFGGGESGSGSGESGGLTIHRVTKEISSGATFPMLTKTNYHDWVTLMWVMLQARGLWLTVSIDTTDYTKDFMALEVLIKVVPRGVDGDHHEQGNNQGRMGLSVPVEH
jgi:hypothetical protein